MIILILLFIQFVPSFTSNCGEGKFGENCDMECHNLCIFNGGVCHNYTTEDVAQPSGKRVTRIECDCPSDKFGRFCQYDCESGDVEECSQKLMFNEECRTILIRQPSVTQISFNRSYSEFFEGFGDADCANFPKTEMPGECFWGLKNLRDFRPQGNSTKFSTLKFVARFQRIEYVKTCVDVVVHGPPIDDRIVFAQCYGNEKFETKYIKRMNFKRFTTYDNDVDEDDLNCADKAIGRGGWWYDTDCQRFLRPTGKWGSREVFNTVYLEDITGLVPPKNNLDYFRLDVCTYGCDEGKYGDNCDLECDKDCVKNGGKCTLVNYGNLAGELDSQTVERVECTCPPGLFGRSCQLECPENEPVSSCVANLTQSTGKECVTVVRRGSGLGTSFDRDYEDYKTGFGGDECLSGDCWLGLNNLYKYSPFFSKRPTTLAYKFTFQSIDYNYVCPDVVFKDEMMGYMMIMDRPQNCYVSPVPSTNQEIEVFQNAVREIAYHSQVRFSARNFVNDFSSFGSSGGNCAESENYGGGWYYRNCGYISPTTSVNELAFHAHTGSTGSVYLDNFEIEMCRYPCPDGFYGQFCNVQCSQECVNNGGTCVLVGGEITPEDATHSLCECPVNYYGTDCQFFCSNGDLKKCVESLDLEKECTTLVRRVDGSVDFDRDYHEYARGFGECINGECWGGLEHISDFISDTQGDDRTGRFSTLEFFVEYDNTEYRKTCVDFVLDQDDGNSINIGECFGDDELASSDIYFMRKAKFSSKNLDLDTNMDENCANIYSGAWWYTSDDCHRIHPTGLYGTGVTNKRGLVYESLTGVHDGVSVFQIDVCNYNVRESCTDLVIHQTDSLNFDVVFKDYVTGFGDCRTGDCFVSLDYLSYISTHSEMTGLNIKFDMMYSGEAYKAHCGVHIGDRENAYQLKLWDCEGDDELSMADILYHNNMRFSAKDYFPPDAFEGARNCSNMYKTAWWYYDCYKILPTGKFAENMHFDSLTSSFCGESLTKFNMEVCGSIPEKNGLEKVNEYRGRTCKKFLIRKNGDVSFSEQKYQDYVNGFGGDCGKDEECWLGLNNLHQMTSSEPKKLIVDMMYDGRQYSLACLGFRVDDEANEFRFEIGKCHGSGVLDREMIKRQAGKAFTTMDHPVGPVHCPGQTNSGWWFDDTCGGVHPTGQFGSTSSGKTGMFYESLTGFGDSGKISIFELSICGTFEEELEFSQCTTFLNRFNGDLSFDRTYSEYMIGFGDPTNSGREGWLGLETLHQMTEIPQYIDIQYIHDDYQFGIHCGLFTVEAADEDYAIHFDFCESDDGDDPQLIVQALMNHNGARFSTYDHPSSSSYGNKNCAISARSGWWFIDDGPVGDCFDFHATGIFGIVDDKVGINVGHRMKLDAISMSLCRIRDRSRSKQDFFDAGGESISARSCTRDCAIFHNREYNLRKGEQMFMFDDSFYRQLPTTSPLYLDIHTGPGTFALAPDVKSFYSKTFDFPVIFSLNDFNMNSRTGNNPQMMYVRDTCMFVETCGWGPLGLRPGSAYVPEKMRLTFYTERLDGAFSDDVDMYELPAGQCDTEMTFDAQSWLLEYRPDMEDVDYPVFYKDPYFGGISGRRELRYDCTKNCKVDDFYSLYVPSGYVVEIFSEDVFEGISRKFVGPMSFDVMDGHFLFNNVKSYKSDISRIEKIEVHIVEFLLDEATTVEEGSTNVNSIIVNNPTGEFREMLFTDTYKVGDKRTYRHTDFWEMGCDFDTNVEVTSNSSFSSEKTESSYAEAYAWVKVETGDLPNKTNSTGSGGPSSPGGSGNGTSSNTNGTQPGINNGTQPQQSGGNNGTQANNGTQTEETPGKVQKKKPEIETDASMDAEFGASYKYTESSSTETSELVYFSNSSETEKMGIIERVQTKTFHYQCLASPYTITTCQAKQVVGKYDIPYNALKRIIYSDGEVIELPFRGSIRNSVATRVFYVVQETKLASYCLEDAYPFQGHCYRGVKWAEEEEISDLVGGLLSPLDANYLPMSIAQAEHLCFQYEGSDISSVHSGMENSFFERLCTNTYPIVIGTVYKHAVGKHKNFDQTEFDYSRFNKTVGTPTTDSYVVMEKDGFWKYASLNTDPPVGKCTVCKLKVT